MENETGDYFKVVRKILRLFGISLNGNESDLYKFYSYAFLTVFPYLYCVLSVVELFKEHDFEDFCVTLVYISCMGLAVVKVTIVLLNRKELGKILNNLQSGLFLANHQRGGEIEAKLIEDCISFNDRQRKFYISADVASLAGSVVNALVKRLANSDYRNWDLGFGSFSIIDISKSPNYEIVMVYQDISFIFCGFTFMTTDLMFVEILSHLTVQFKILQNNLRFILENNKRRIRMNVAVTKINSKDDDENITVPKELLERSLKEIIIHHLSVMEIASRIEKIYRPLLLIIYISNMLILCFGVYMASVLQDPTKKFAFITGQSTVLFQLFVTCYWCDQMTTESRAVGNAAYEANFVGTHSGFQKDLIFVMQRSMKPTTMTAGKFFNITLPSFLKILQAAYSFIMVVRRKRTA